MDDLRRLVCPGEPDRTNDLLAVLANRAEPRRPVWMVVEREEAPERGMLYRLGQYGLLLGKEVAPSLDQVTEPIVGTLLLNLTGRQQPPALRWQLPGASG
jgi:hypothetical protein